MNILVIGCNGFVGASFGACAIDAGHSVTGVARSASPPREWRGAYLQADAATADFAALVDATAPELIIHGAGTASVAASLRAPREDLMGSIVPWSNLLEGVRRSARRPLLFFPSSAAVYGEPATLPIGEDAPARPVSPYGFHKQACELLAREFCECFGLDVLVARFFSLYGPRQRRLLVWELFEQARGAAPEIVLEGTGDETRDYLHIDDAARAALEIAAAPRTRGLQIVNFASGSELRVAALAATMARVHGKSRPVRALGRARAGDPARWQADTRRLGALSRMRPRPLVQGLEECVRCWNAPR